MPAKRLLFKKVISASAKLIAAMIFVLAVSQNCNSQCPPLGDLSGMTGVFSACPGFSQSYTIVPVTNAISYTWTLPAGCTIYGQNPFTSASTTNTVNFGAGFVPPGNISVTATNGCVTKGPLFKTIFSAGVPSGASTISGPISACPGDVVIYSVTNIANRTYTWTAPSGAAITGGQGTNTAEVTFNNGFTNQSNLCVSVSNGCASSASRCMTVIRNIPPTPAAISGPAFVCGGQRASYTVPSNAATSNYIWIIPVGCTIVSGQGTTNITVDYPANYIYGQINVYYSNACATSGVTSLSVRSVPATPLPTTGISAGLCNGSTTYSVPVITGAISYAWTITGGASISAGQGTANVTASFPSNFNIGKVCVYASNQCGNGTPRCLNLKKDIDITVQPTNYQTCSNTSAIFTASAVGLNLNYQWRKNNVPLVNGANISGAQSPNLTINSANQGMLGNYDVVVSNGCSPNATSSSAQLILNNVPAAPSPLIGGALVTCPGTTNVAYSIPLQVGSTSYLWYVSNGATITSGQGTNAITVDFGATINSGYYISVKGINQCGIGTDSSHTWTRYSISTPTFVTGPIKVCQGTNGIAYAVQNIGAGVSYLWTTPTGANIASGQGTNSATIDFALSFISGNIGVSASNQCYTTPVKNLAVALDIPSMPSSISGSAFSACNTTLTYSTPAVQGSVSYSWTIPVGGTLVSGAGTNTVDIAFTNPGNSQLCVAANSSCNQGAQRCIAVKSIPIAPPAISANPVSFCKNQAGVLFSTSTPAAVSTTYHWAVPLGSTIVSGQNTSAITVNMGASNGNVSVTGVNACGNGSTRTFAVVMPCRVAGNSNDNDVSDAESKLSVYPNPAQNIANVLFNSANENQYTIQLFDMLGNLVYTEGGIAKIGFNRHELTLKNLPKGLYLLSLKQQDDVRHVKLQVK